MERAQQYLVVWEQSDTHKDIYGVRADSAGKLLDTAGKPISDTPYYARQSTPSVAHDGTNFLVVWKDQPNYAVADTDIVGARVSGSGKLLDTWSLGIPIGVAKSNQENPAVVYDKVNQQYLVVWDDQRGLWRDIYGARVSKSGSVLDPSGIAISTHKINKSAPAVALGGASYLVVWHDFRNNATCPDIYGTRVNKDGKVLDSTEIHISGPARSQKAYQRYPAVSHDGSSFLVVWQDNPVGTHDYDIHGARVSNGGAVLDTSGIVISSAKGRQERPAVAFDPVQKHYLVLWQDSRNAPSTGTPTYDIYGARVVP